MMGLMVGFLKTEELELPRNVTVKCDTVPNVVTLAAPIDVVTLFTNISIRHHNFSRMKC